MAKKNNPATAELRRLLRKYPDTQTMELLIPDVLGVLKGKRIRRKDFEKTCSESFWFCGGTVLLNVLGEVIEGLPGYSDGDPDTAIARYRAALAGDPHLLEAHGRLAQALEHEVDPVNGTLYVDRVDSKEDLVKLEPVDPTLAEQRRAEATQARGGDAPVTPQPQ